MTTPLTPSERQGQWLFAHSLALLALRLILGWIFVYAGAGKLFGAFGSHITMQGFASFLHLPVLPPLAWAYIAAISEFACGILIMLGLLTRLAAIPLIITMLVAIAIATGQYGFGGTFDKDGFHMGYQYNLTLIAISVALILSGPGLLSLDALIFKRNLLSRGPQPLS